MKATKLFHDRSTLADGSIVEMTIWRLVEGNPERLHELKYSLYRGRAGERQVGYDNERGKGDHRHIGERELRYRFDSVEQLVAYFLADAHSVQQDRLKRKD